MIILTKTQRPNILVTNAETWRDDLMTTIGSGQKPTTTQKNRYNHPDIKNQLLIETHEKCLYCESKIRHIDDGDIEHIIPKSVHPELSFDWENLSLACTICNRNKGDHYDPGSAEEVINPYTDSPADHFLFHRDFLTPLPQSLRAQYTDQLLELNRAELRERRAEKISQLHDFITAYAQADETYKPLVVRQIKRYCVGADKEYSAFLQAYIEEMIGLNVLPDNILE